MGGSKKIAGVVVGHKMLYGRPQTALGTLNEASPPLLKYLQYTLVKDGIYHGCNAVQDKIALVSYSDN